MEQKVCSGDSSSSSDDGINNNIDISNNNNNNTCANNANCKANILHISAFHVLQSTLISTASSQQHANEDM